LNLQEASLSDYFWDPFGDVKFVHPPAHVEVWKACGLANWELLKSIGLLVLVAVVVVWPLVLDWGVVFP
jgi:hypothetical protein